MKVIYAPLDWGFSEQLEDLGGSSVLDATYMYLPGVVVPLVHCMLSGSGSGHWTMFVYSAWDF